MIYLQRLVIRNNKVIQDLTLDFEELKPMTVLIGENGSGKTTVLESLTAIFAALHQRAEGLKVIAPAFDFELIYLISLELVIEETSISRIDKTHFVEVQVTGGSNQPNIIQTVVGGDMNRSLTKDLLPNLVIYYPGSSDTLLHTYQHFIDDRKENLRAKPTNSAEAFSRIKDLPIFYCKKQHFDMLLAALLAFEYSQDVDDFFANKLHIGKPDLNIIVLFIKPNHFRKGFSPEEFWGADGEVRRFLDTIRELSSEEYIHDTEVGIGMKFFFGLDEWYQLRAAYGDEKTLFLMLNMLDASDLLDGVFINLHRGEKGFPHFLLSEGERQMIITKGLVELLFDDHTLFLMDEPNVFMHPGWQSSFMEELNEYAERASFIITTHSPIILSNIRNGHLIRMTAGQGEPITGHYYGRRYSDNLEDIMGTPARISAVSDELQILFDLIDEERYDDAETKLNTLRETLGEDDADIVRAQTMLNFYR